MKNVWYQEHCHNELICVLLVQYLLLYMGWEIVILFPTMCYRKENKNMVNSQCSLQNGTIFSTEQIECAMLP